MTVALPDVGAAMDNDVRYRVRFERDPLGGGRVVADRWVWGPEATWSRQGGRTWGQKNEDARTKGLGNRGKPPEALASCSSCRCRSGGVISCISGCGYGERARDLRLIPTALVRVRQATSGAAY